MKYMIIFILILTWCFSVEKNDYFQSITYGSEIYKDCKIEKITPAQMVISHEYGIKTLNIHRLEKTFIKKHFPNYNFKNAKAYMQKMHDKKIQTEAVKHQKKMINLSLDNMKVTRDKLEKINKYQDKDAFNRRGTRIELIFYKNDNGEHETYFRVYFIKNKWLFINKFFIDIEGKRYNFDNSIFKREVMNNGKIKEYCSIKVDKNIMEMLLSMITRKKVSTIRFTGSDYYDDHEITSNEKISIGMIILARYNLLKK